MSFPVPQPGLVISYAFLWSHEHRAGVEEGRKDRPCVIVLSVTRRPDGETLVRVAPTTHSAPRVPAAALEIPLSVKRHLGLDAERSWVILDEYNEFIWPGFDLRPLRQGGGRIVYGFLPPRLFADLVMKVRLIWRSGSGQPTRRD
jgi:hypothetical protein